MKSLLVLAIAFGAIMRVSPTTCGSDTCASDEECNNSGTACQCNSTVYINKLGSLPAPTVNCDGGNMEILVSKCWLEKNAYNTSSIRLESLNCTAARKVVNGTAEMALKPPLTLTADNCNTTVEINATHVTYWNSMYIFAKTIPIQTRPDVVARVSCSYPLNMSVQLNIALHPVLGSTTIDVPGINGQFALNIAAYTDSSFTTLLSDTALLYVDDTVYISVRVENLDISTFNLNVKRIYATPGAAAFPQYDLLVNGCPAGGLTSDLMTVIRNRNGSESLFAMKVFQIAGFSSIQLTAEVVLCTNDCKDCNSRSLSTANEGISTSVSVYLDAAERYDDSSANGLSLPWTLSTLIFSWVLMKLV
ncbi:pancreatic secretory granule membrane major glycoprotein GP2-like [Hyperolius riggenbachi]|uniref:pancreatic secretory granule membrane major glycoprotein GP2-like n=1 Tax=Hyperolius riggenbachi TaxID=752182 RepID=UPI0035A343F9